jgi:hypothetical protein
MGVTQIQFSMGAELLLNTLFGLNFRQATPSALLSTESIEKATVEQPFAAICLKRQWPTGLVAPNMPMAFLCTQKSQF